ncbi:ABC transporter ATP-binding protein [Lachnospiraceae bacterium 29-91]
MRSVVLKARGLKKYYYSGENVTKALDGIDLDVCYGEFAAIVGTSGSGKSTLLHMLGGLDSPTEGTVRVGEKELNGMNDEELAVFRRRSIGFVFQQYNLVQTLNVRENITLPVLLDGGTIDEDYCREIVTLLKIDEKLEQFPGQLSGGQQQRVAIARALAGKPSIVLADEPTGNLDSKTSQDVMAFLKAGNQRFQQTMVMITHNPEIARMADRIIRIEDGRIKTGAAGREEAGTISGKGGQAHVSGEK